MAFLAIVAANGSIYFSSPDIQDCRTFLRARGLECTILGWHSAKERGLIDYRDGEWHAGVTAVKTTEQHA